MRVLVIGSDSFIARNFISTYQSIFSFKSISRLSTGFKEEIVLEDLFSIPNHIFKDVDTVLNFAAIVHRLDIKDKELYDRVNHQLVLHNAYKAKQAGVKLFIQISTIAVYGNTNSININTPCNPINPYGCSKFNADEGLLKLQDENFKVAIVRPPMVYGGGKAPGNMMRLIKLVDRRIPLPFKGIDNKRDFIHVNNLIQYLFIIAEKHLNGIFIISDRESISTEDLVKTISKSLGKMDFLVKVPSFFLKLLCWLRPNDYNKLFGTLCIENNFQYEDLIKRFSVEQGIQEMVECYKTRN